MNLSRDDWRANAVGLLEYAQKKSKGENTEPPLSPELTGGTHGMGTAGILAGSWVAIDEKKVPGGRIKGYYGWLGGAPFAKVVPVRVAPWVFSFSTGELAYPIDYASRVKGCAVYYALLKTADRRGRAGADPYFGAGLLRADDALNLNYAEIKKARRPEGHIEADRVPVGSLWFEKTSNDYFDGARSFLGLLGLQTLHHVDPNDRAKLRQKPVRGETRIEALQRLYYNMLLLREWHGGDIPRKGSHEECIGSAGRKG